MPITAMLTIRTGYLAGARRAVRQHLGPPDAGASTLELVMIILGAMAIAAILVVAITAAVQRRVDQIN